MARRRRQRQGDSETEKLGNGLWSGYNEQCRLQDANHSQEANDEARRRTQQLLQGGYGSIDWGDLISLWSEK